MRVVEARTSVALGSAFLLIALGHIFGSYFAGILAGATDFQTTFLAFAGTAVLATIFGPECKDS